jgi:import inner membrane translocase subunit TIM50
LDEEGNATGPLKDIGDWINAQAANMMGLDGKPSREKLLPEIVPHMRYPSGKAPLTLVLAIEDTLLHESWHRRTGFRLAKRPGVDKFLEGVSTYYEVVFWSELAGGLGQEVVFNLDRQRGYYHHELHQGEACAIGRKQYVKDLSYLNRDLRRVIVIDSNPKNLRRQPANLCEITPFSDPETQTDDTELLDLIPFLQQVAIQQMANDEPVTDILARYGNKDVGGKYKRKIQAMAAAAEMKASQGSRGALKKKREAAAR